MVVAAVDVSALVDVVWVSFLAGTGITVAFSIVVLGSGRSATARRDGRTRLSIAYAAVATIAFALFVAGVVIGVNIMLSKD